MPRAPGKSRLRAWPTTATTRQDGWPWPSRSSTSGAEEEARAELERVLADVPDHPIANETHERLFALETNEETAGEGDDGVGEAEIDAAFDQAEARPDEMWSANHVAEATLRGVEGGAPEGVALPDVDSPFATETVAGLPLAAQGHGERANEIRRTLAAGTGDETAHAAAQRRERIISTLERWLANLRGGNQ